MQPNIHKTVVRLSFDTVLHELTCSLKAAGFVICGNMDFKKDYLETLKVHVSRYTILTIDLPRLSSLMLAIEPTEGTVLPCQITVIETAPGECLIIPVNPSDLIAQINDDSKIRNLTRQLNHALQEVTSGIDRGTSKIPDLVTSWG